MQLLMVLQNPYSRGRLDDHGWNGSTWRYELSHSHTGIRMKEMFPDNYKVIVTNASPKMGKKSSDCFPPDIRHLKRVIKRTKPDIILAAGRMAQKAIDEIQPSCKVMKVPHPAWRGLSHKCTKKIKQHLERIKSDSNIHL
jgi:hypothetical protein